MLAEGKDISTGSLICNSSNRRFSNLAIGSYLQQQNKAARLSGLSPASNASTAAMRGRYRPPAFRRIAVQLFPSVFSQHVTV
jgi:hypothetical protein